MLLTDRYSSKIQGIISCYDRVIIQGTLPILCYAKGMTGYLMKNNIRIFDYPRFAEPLRDLLRDNAEKLARDNGLEIDFIRRNNFRKESKIKDILKERGDAPGMVHIFSAMESCESYKPWHNKKTHKTYLKPNRSKCLHYYFYFIDEHLGLCYVRVPTWCPFRLQIYFNGHNWLAAALTGKGIRHSLVENAFLGIDSFTEAQQMTTAIQVDLIHKKLDRFAERFCPVIKELDTRYHWSIMQVEYATDIIFKRQQDLQDIYENLVRSAIHTVKPENVVTFLGRKLHPRYQGEIGNDFSMRIKGTRIKHTMGPASIKMYDKFGRILRIETTTNDVSFFKHYRKVEHRDGTESRKLAPFKKGIYSLPALQGVLHAANKRYLQHISDIDDDTAGIKKLERVSRTVIESHRPYKGFNFFSKNDQKLFEIIASGDFLITGFQNKHLKAKLPGKKTGQISRILKRLRNHGLIKKVAHTYKYYLTRFGSQGITMGLKLRELVIIPRLAQ